MALPPGTHFVTERWPRQSILTAPPPWSTDGSRPVAGWSDDAKALLSQGSAEASAAVMQSPAMVAAVDQLANTAGDAARSQVNKFILPTLAIGLGVGWFVGHNSGRARSTQNPGGSMNLATLVIGGVVLGGIIWAVGKSTSSAPPAVVLPAGKTLDNKGNVIDKATGIVEMALADALAKGIAKWADANTAANANIVAPDGETWAQIQAQDKAFEIAQDKASYLQAVKDQQEFGDDASTQKVVELANKLLNEGVSPSSVSGLYGHRVGFRVLGV